MKLPDYLDVQCPICLVKVRLPIVAMNTKDGHIHMTFDMHRMASHMWTSHRV
jgi:hypothetical protein